jgi:hypothetical protein
MTTGSLKGVAKVRPLAELKEAPNFPDSGPPQIGLRQDQLIETNLKVSAISGFKCLVEENKN